VRDQIAAQRVGNRSGIGSKSRSASAGQRPVRRDRDAARSFAARLRNLLGYVPVALKFGLVVAVGVLVFLGYRAAASASFFQIRNIETRGVSRASQESIKAIVRRDAGQSGVWRADLSELSSHLEQLPWVRTAIVTRVLPDGIRVRITERQPRAVIRTSAGRFFWVDEDAVVLGEMLPTDQMPGFFLRGWNEDESAAARKENRERVQKFLELQADWDALSLSDRVSEVNLGDLSDVRAQLAGDDSQIELRLGSQDLGERLKKALNVLDTQRQTSRGPFISYIDLTQGKRAIVGLISGARAVSESTESSSDSTFVGPVSAAEQIRSDKAAGKAAKDKGQKTRNQTTKADQKRT
jgi:cell division protein FtsQ